jgi:uncharacterized RDD family membrane protein YckC
MNWKRAVSLRTPEGVTFTLLPAGPISRFAAWAIDCVCIIIIYIVLTIVTRLASIVSSDIASAMSAIIFFVISLGYGIFLEWRFHGRTIGKYLFSLRVMDAEGFGLTLSQVIIRNLLRVVDLLPICYLVGGAVSVITPKCQRLGDLAANTVVVIDEKATAPDMDQIASPKYNSLRDYPHLVARIRRNTSERQAHIALEALLRRDEIDPLPRVELFADIAVMLKSITPLPQEVTEGVTDEQFVRNVVDVLYRQNKSIERATAAN